MCFSTVCLGGLYVLTLRWWPFKCSILYLFKTPPSCFNGTKFWIYSKRPPPTSEKAVTTTKEPIKSPNSVFIQNAPLLLSKKRLLPEKSPQSDKILYLIKTTPSYIITVVQNFVFIQNAPLLLQKNSGRPYQTQKNWYLIQNAPLSKITSLSALFQVGGVHFRGTKDVPPAFLMFDRGVLDAKETSLRIICSWGWGYILERNWTSPSFYEVPGGHFKDRRNLQLWGV